MIDNHNQPDDWGRAQVGQHFQPRALHITKENEIIHPILRRIVKWGILDPNACSAMQF